MKLAPHAGAMGREDEPTFVVTTAAPDPQVDRRQRERQYLILMGFRVIAIIVAILVARGWIRIVAIAAALILPWIAVIVANSTGPRGPAGIPTPVDPHRKRIES